jgi:CRISP-associated protein Cas1
VSHDDPTRARDGEQLGARAKHLPLITPRAEERADLVPARMLNEVLYCERLMYLEWVQREFADNAFTVEGRYVHERADAAGGELPPVPERDDESEESGDQGPTVDEARPYQARAVWLSSENLGLTAKIDIVEGSESGKVVPIEYKRGKAPRVPGGAYLPEQAQLCAHVLLLREHGYRCDEAAIYFSASRKRVPVAITEHLIATTLAGVARARELARQEDAPPPLDNSPKCRGCSLVGICLPDEVNLLRRLRGEPVVDSPDEEDALWSKMEPDPWGLATPAVQTESLRRLHAARDDRVPIYVQDYRSRVSLSGHRLVIESPEGGVHARLMNTSQVAVFGNVQITTQALRALLERGIPVSFHTSGGWLLGRTVAHDSNNVALRLAQYRRASDPIFCLAIACRIVTSKIKNSRTMLRRNHDQPDAVLLGQLKQLARKAAEATSLETLLGIEGAAARVYFQAFTGMLKSIDGVGTFDMESRNRRPPRDPINALLSFVYALLTRELANTVGGVGLDPLLGFYHQPRFGRPALALDLMEEMRPIVADSVVIAAVNTGVVGSDDFVRTSVACNLTASGRRKLIDAYERRMDQEITHPVFGYRISYRRVLEVQARLLSRVLLGEIADYPTFGTR